MVGFTSIAVSLAETAVGILFRNTKGALAFFGGTPTPDGVPEKKYL